MAVNFQNGLVMACRLRSIENISGTDVTRDVSGNNRHPVKVGNPTLSEANGFSGGNTANYFNMGSFITVLNGATAYGISMMTKDVARAVNKTAFSMGGSSAATTLNIYPADVSGTAVYCNNAIRYPGASNLVPVNDGNWHNIVFTMINTAEARLYLDGVEVTPNSSANCSMPNPLTGGTIGCWHVGPAQPYGGQIKDLLIFSRALSAGDAISLAAGDWPSSGNSRSLLGVGT